VVLYSGEQLDSVAGVKRLDHRSVVRIAGVVVWTMVGVPLIFQPAIEPWRLLPWAIAYVAFIASFIASAARARPPIVLLAVEVAACIGMVLLLCQGFEGSLLVLVALQVGARFDRRRDAIWWVVGASALLAASIAIHWSPRASLLLVPPYFGFQVLAVMLAAAYRELEAAHDLAEENARLEERLSIARELHDTVGHHLTALSLNLEAIARKVEGEALEPVHAARSLAKLVLEDVRSVVDGLREAERTDLAVAMRAIAARIPRPRIHLTLPDTISGADAESALTVLRCTQEIVTNAARHANAENLWVTIVEAGAELELRAWDDGKGASALLPGNGLAIMRERLEARGGRLEIESRVGSGFSVRAAIPIQKPPIQKPSIQRTA
jgi:signal transduction histidine kinase